MFEINYTQEELEKAIAKATKYLAKKRGADFGDYDIEIIRGYFPRTTFLHVANQTAVEVYVRGRTVEDIEKDTNRVKASLLFDLRDFQAHVIYGMDVCESRNRAKEREGLEVWDTPIEELGLPNYLETFCKNNLIDTIGKLEMVCNEEEKTVNLENLSAGNEQEILKALKDYREGEIHHPRVKAKNTGRRTAPGKLTVKW